MKINYENCIFYEKYLGLVCLSVHFNAGKHGGLQQIVARLMHATLPVSCIEGCENQIVPRLHRSLVNVNATLLFMVVHRNLCLITKYILTVQFPFKLDHLDERYASFQRDPFDFGSNGWMNE